MIVALACLVGCSALEDEDGLEELGPVDGKADGPGRAVVPAAEACQRTALDAAFLRAPAPLRVDAGRSRARLIEPLRAAARTRDARQILVRAVAENVRAFRDFDSFAAAQALADLAVTGRAAYDSFKALAPTDEWLLRASREAISAGTFGPTLPGSDLELEEAVTSVLDRAYRVAWALRGPTAHRVRARSWLGWIAVSGEDDAPHRPVNVTSAPYPQHDVSYSVRAPLGPIGVTVRAMVAGGDDAGPTFAPRAVPVDAPLMIPPGDIVLYVPGHGSRLEEGTDMIPHLQREATARGRRLVVVSLDHPSAGYASRIEHTRIAAPEASKHNVGYPALDFLEENIVAFVAELDRRQPGTAARVVGVIGGSLGGNLSLRLARRQAPWLRNVVAWSPVSIWESWGPASLVPHHGEYFDLVKHEAVRISRDRMNEAEQPGSRATFLDQTYGPPFPGQRPVSDRWYRDGWEPCRSFLVEGSQRAADEIYGPVQRRFQWRVAHEVLIFSHRDPDPGDTRPRYSTVKARLLVAAGAADEHFPEFLYSKTREVAAWAGWRSLFLEETGHSIHNERPRWFSRQVMDFLLPR